MTQRDGMGREVGGGFRMGKTCTPMADACWCMAKPIQYCKVKNNNNSNKNLKKWCVVEDLSIKLIADFLKNIYLFGYTGSYLQHTYSQLPHLWPSSLTMDWIWPPCVGSLEFESLDHQGSPSLVLVLSVYLGDLDLVTTLSAPSFLICNMQDSHVLS